MRIDDLSEAFRDFYLDRIGNGLAAEKSDSIMSGEGVELSKVRELILKHPFRRFEDMRFMHHRKTLGTIQMDQSIFKRLDRSDIDDISAFCNEAFARYFSRFG